MNIESSSSAVVVSMVALNKVTALQRARSCDHFLTSQLRQRSCSPIAWSSAGRRRQDQVGQKRVGFILSYFIHSIDPIMGPGSQNLDRIGATGYMVLRMGVSCWREAASRTLQRVA